MIDFTSGSEQGIDLRKALYNKATQNKEKNVGIKTGNHKSE